MDIIAHKCLAVEELLFEEDGLITTYHRYPNGQWDLVRGKDKFPIIKPDFFERKYQETFPKQKRKVCDF